MSSGGSNGSNAAGSGGEHDLDVLPSQVSGAHEVHGELGFVAAEDVEDSVLLDVEVSLHSGSWDSGGGRGHLLKHTVELEEVAQGDEVPGASHGIGSNTLAYTGIAG